MKVQDFLEKFAHQVEYDSDIGGETRTYNTWRTNFDNTQLCHVGQEDNDAIVKSLAENEITEQLSHGTGFSPSLNKWFGWSHRAMYGFTIGSTCEKGDCHYNAESEEGGLEAALEFWRCDDYDNVRSEGVIKNDQGEFYNIKWDYKDSVPNKSLHGTIGGVEHYIKPLGRGEWTAKTMEDAKQMAIDFNKGVS